MTVWPTEKVLKGKEGAAISSTEANYEPKFMKEGELFIMESPASDTLAVFDIEIAEQPTERNYGMMYRKSMDPNMAMLFIMDREEPQSFWMKNTYVSLDIIYINENMEVVSIQKNARPLDETSLPSGEPAKYVLEVKGGLSDKLNLKKGDKISVRKS